MGPSLEGNRLPRVSRSRGLIAIPPGKRPARACRAWRYDGSGLPGASMASHPAVGALYARISEFCLAFPEAEREVHGRHADFRVRKRPFAYFLDDHHGDGIV